MIIPPRRHEALTVDGLPTLRFITFLESLANRDSVTAVTLDFTSSGSAILICTNVVPITITLNASPSDLEELHIKRQGALVTVDAGAQTIDGVAVRPLSNLYDSPHLIFTTTGAEWSII